MTAASQKTAAILEPSEVRCSESYIKSAPSLFILLVSTQYAACPVASSSQEVDSLPLHKDQVWLPYRHLEHAGLELEKLFRIEVCVTRQHMVDYFAVWCVLYAEVLHLLEMTEWTRDLQCASIIILLRFAGYVFRVLCCAKWLLSHGNNHIRWQIHIGLCSDTNHLMQSHYTYADSSTPKALIQTAKPSTQFRHIPCSLKVLGVQYGNTRHVHASVSRKRTIVRKTINAKTNQGLWKQQATRWCTRQLG